MIPDPNNNVQAVDQDDIDTTAPSPRFADAASLGEWKMPEPVFRKTSGKLPTGFEKKFETDGASPSPPEVSSYSAAAAAPEPRPKSPTLKIVVVVLALAAMIAFLVVFLSVVYFFFFRSSSPI